MKNMRWMGAVLLVAALCVGCGSGETAEQKQAAASSAAPAKTETSAPPPEAADSSSSSAGAKAAPNKVVEQFLTALQVGDKTTADTLLSEKARRETKQKGLQVDPPGTTNVAFRVGEVKFAGENENTAHVNSVWIESDGSGAAQDYEVVWVLRKQSNGWRIAGMAAQLTPDQEPVFLNFENPDEMLRKWREADAQLQAEQVAGSEPSSPAEARQAEKPEKPQPQSFER